MSSGDKYSQGGKYAPHRYNSGNKAYNPIVYDTGPSLGCITLAVVILTIVIFYFVYLY